MINQKALLCISSRTTIQMLDDSTLVMQEQLGDNRYEYTAWTIIPLGIHVVEQFKIKGQLWGRIGTFNHFYGQPNNAETHRDLMHSIGEQCAEAFELIYNSRFSEKAKNSQNTFKNGKITTN